MGKGDLSMKIGILTTERISKHKLSVIKQILNQKKFQINGVYVDTKKPLSGIDKFIKNIKRGRGFYVIVMIIEKLFRSKDITYSVKEIFQKKIIYSIENLYSASTINMIKKNNHDVLVLVNGYGIIKEPILSIVTHGVLSFHHGNIRKYRGMPPLFWEYYHGEKECGATVQRLSEKLDAGEIMAETAIEINYSKSFKYNKEKLYKKSEILIAQALDKVDNSVNGSVPKTLGKVYTLPNFKEWCTMIIKTNVKKLIILFKD